MTPRSLAEVLVKLLGVYWIVNAVVSLPGLASYRFMAGSAEGLATGWKALAIPILTVVLYLTLGAWLLANGRKLAARLAPDQAPTVQFTSQTAQAIAFSVLGLYLACSGVASLAADFAAFASLEGRETEWVREEYFARERAAIASSGLYLVAGVALFFAGGPLARLWHRLHPMTPAADREEAR